MSPFSRRALFQSASAFVAAEAALQILSSPLLGRLGSASRLRRAILDGDGAALAQGAASAPKNPLFVFTCHAKWDSAGWLNRPNQAAKDVVGNAACGVSSAYPTLGLTVQFGDYLKDVEGDVGMAVCPVTSVAAGHTYSGLRTALDKTGCLASYVNSANGALMSLYFASVGSVDGATACFGPGGQQLITYGDIDSAVNSLLKAIDPLSNLAAPAQTLLTHLNDRILKDPKFRAGLEDIAARLRSAQDPLRAAAARAQTNPATTLTAANQMTPDVLMANNPLIPQLDVAFALIDRGLTQAVDISAANSDPNSGGGHADQGGQNVAYGGRSPNEVKSCVAQALAYIYKKYPNAICSFNSDGGRGPDGADTGNYEGLITGPKDLIKTVFVNGDSRADSATFGSDAPAVALSDGSTAVPTQANLMATMAKAAGIRLGDYAYIPQMLVDVG
jgi:hypothetical protein